MSEGEQPTEVTPQQLQPIPTAAEVRGDVTLHHPSLVLQERYEGLFSVASIEGRRAYEHLKGLQRHYSHKSKWSYFLMATMSVMIWFQSYLLYKVGTGQWNFTQYDWLLPALLVQNLAQIAGLCLIVVKALFKDQK
jgi:hypothetical protein